MSAVNHIIETIRAYEAKGNYREADVLDQFLRRHFASLRSWNNIRTASDDEYADIDWSDPDAWKRFVPQKEAPVQVEQQLSIDELPKSVRRFLNIIKSGKLPGEMHQNELEEIAQALGFNVANTTDHMAVSHPALVNNPKFNNGIIGSINNHAHGQKGRIHYKGIEDFRDAIKYVHPHLVK